MIIGGALCVVCAENMNEVGEHVYQLLAKASELHKCGGGEVIAVCVGINHDICSGLYKYGANKIIVCDIKPNNRYEFADVVTQILSSCKPELVMVPSSNWGETCASEIAIKLSAGLTANCMDISIEDEYVFTRTALNGSIFAKITANDSNISICTVQRNMFQKKVINKCESEKVCVVNKSICTSIVDDIEVIQCEKVENYSKIECLDFARIVFGFGRGLAINDIQLLNRVARKYHAEVVGTRAVCEQGLITRNRQVGQSGISIAPMLYVAFGISGASQHMVGVMNAHKIVSINKDIDAPINAFSNEVIIADCSSVLRRMDEMIH